MQKYLVIKGIIKPGRFVFLVMSFYALALPGIAAESDAVLPDGRFAIAGYGDVTYEESDLQDSSVFVTSFNPIFLFRLNNNLHVEAEVEMTLDDTGGTETELEYADIHYFLTDTVTLTAGKFLLPFGQFSQNLHPSWINRTPWTPGIYGSHQSAQAMTALLPVLSDVGVALQKTFVLNTRQKVFVDVFMTNGARAEAEHDEGILEEIESDEHDEELPEVEFEATSGDNNKNKAFGGRVAYAFLPNIEIGASYYNASYDDIASLDITAKGLDINYFTQHFLLRGEYIETDTDGLEEAEDGGIDIHNFRRNGWYLQGTFHLGGLFESLGSTEFVVERAKTNKLEEADRWVYGLNYWIDPRSVIKIAYEDTSVRDGADDKRLAIQFSYGF